jgi:hypothetical protein
MELIKRATDLIKFYVYEEILEEEHLQLLFEFGYDLDGYDSIGYDKEEYDRLGYNHLGYNKEGYNKDGYNKFNKIKQIESKFIANEEIDVIYELSRYSNRYKADNRTSIPQVAHEYLWEIITEGKKGG